MDPQNATVDGCYMVDNHPTKSQYVGTNHIQLYAIHNERVCFTPINMSGQYSVVLPTIIRWANSGAWGYFPLPKKYTVDDIDVWVAEIGGDRGQTYTAKALCKVGDTGDPFYLTFQISVS